MNHRSLVIAALALAVTSNALLEGMRKSYDTQISHVTRQVVQGHGYENYPTLFNRTVPWEQKAGLIQPQKGDAGEGEVPDKPKKKGKGNK